MCTVHTLCKQTNGKTQTCTQQNTQKTHIGKVGKIE